MRVSRQAGFTALICVGLTSCALVDEPDRKVIKQTELCGVGLATSATAESFGTSVHQSSKPRVTAKLHAIGQAVGTPPHQVDLRCPVTGMPVGSSYTAASADKTRRKHYSKSRGRRRLKDHLRHRQAAFLLMRCTCALRLSALQLLIQRRGMGQHATAKLAIMAALQFSQRHSILWLPVSMPVLGLGLLLITLCHWQLPVTGLQKGMHLLGESACLHGQTSLDIMFKEGPLLRLQIA